MSWTDHEFSMFAALLRRGWPGEFTSEDATVYRLLINDTEPQAAVGALKRLLHRGHRFRPSVAELLAELRVDPSKPTFDEAYRLIFGRRGVLAARPAVRRWADDGERRRLHDEAASERAAEMHPLVGAFVERQGLDRLRALEVDDPVYGELRRRELRAAWDLHTEAFDGREVAALAAGGRSELRRLDPLGALERPTRELTTTAGDVMEEVQP